MLFSTELPSRHHRTSYPEEPKRLLNQFKKLIDEKSLTPKLQQHQKANFLVLPHIDFRVNLSIYAQIYRLLVERETFPSTFIIFGVGHRCPNEFSCCPFTFVTPLGKVPTHEDLWNQMDDLCPDPIALYPETFEGEHSLEYVIIWLQTIRDLYFPNTSFQVLPVLMGGLHQHIRYGIIPSKQEAIYQFGASLKSALSSIQDGPEDLCWIASIDGCHVGPRFQHRFTGNVATQLAVKNWESMLWQKCKNSTLSDFFSHLSIIDNMFYFDGVGVLTLLLQQYKLQAVTEAYELWYQDADQSFVTFTGGVLVEENQLP